MKILMVCLGNICRSPMAEGILQYKADMQNIKWQVESAGTANYHIGEEPHHLAQKVCRFNRIDISQHKGRQFVKEDMLHYDKIYVMDRSNYSDVKYISGHLFDENKIELLLNELHPGEDRNIPDPWYGSEDGYHEVFEMIDMACNQIINKYS